MVEFIIKYWIQFLLILLGAGVTFLLNRYVFDVFKKGKKKEKEDKIKETSDLIDSKIKEANDKQSKEICDSLLHIQEKQSTEFYSTMEKIGHQVSDLSVIVHELRDDLQKIQTFSDDIKQTLRTTYRDKIYQICVNLLIRGYIYDEDIKNLQAMYKMYHNILDGNGELTQVYNKAMDLPLADPNRKD